MFLTIYIHILSHNVLLQCHVTNKSMGQILMESVTSMAATVCACLMMTVSLADVGQVVVLCISHICEPMQTYSDCMIK